MTPPAVTPPAVTPPPAAGTRHRRRRAANTPPPPPATPQAEVVKFAKDAASTYDPAKRAGAEFGPAANAIDKSKPTVWDVTVPADGKPIARRPAARPRQALRAARAADRHDDRGLHASSSTARSSAKELPEDILDKRWEHLTDIKCVTDGKLVSLLNKSKAKQQLLLLYITQPAEPTDPRAAIGNVTVAGTP